MPTSFEPSRPAAPDRSFTVAASTGDYRVAIEQGLSRRLLGEDLQVGAGDRVFLVDDCLRTPFLEAGLDPILVVADEPAKSLDRMTEIVVQLRERRATRRTTLVAVGGGVVQDIAAFAASVYMRGIDWVYVPTTLLSMTDSCIGGKSSINVGPYKNIVGTFHPPVEVLIDPGYAATLNDEQRAAGLCEAAKICLCRSGEAFDAYLADCPAVSSAPDVLVAVVDRSLRAKKWFIEVDEFDRNERLLLNFGHTFGHAIEAATGFAVSHGIAVGLGMEAAFHLGAAMGRDYAGTPRLQSFRAHLDELLASVDGLGAALHTGSVPALMDAFESDKKHGRDRYAVILPRQDGAIERLMLARDADTRALVEGAFAQLLAAHAPARAFSAAA
jgi:3-dehydroquinate synthase